MTKERKLLILISFMVLLATYLGISGIFKSRRAAKENNGIKTELKTEEKRSNPLAPEIENFPLKDLIGKKIVLVNFWASASPNSREAITHLNALFEKYQKEGLEIVGVHTPEFDFETDKERLLSITNELGIKYPVVQDNSYSTWLNYKNDGWPTTYLIDIGGFVVYKHIGEGAYGETETKIRQLLDEKNILAGVSDKKSSDIIKLQNNISENFEFPRSPSLYCGYSRNNLLGIGNILTAGTQTIKKPKSIESDKIYLTGRWDFKRDYAEGLDLGAKIVLKYSAKEVYLIAGSTEKNKISITQDGIPVQSINIFRDDLYKIAKNDSASEHTLEIALEKPGIRVYVVQFR